MNPKLPLFAIVSIFGTCLAQAQTPPPSAAAPTAPAKAKEATVSNSIEYVSKAERAKRTIAEYASNTFYYWNSKDDPAAEPVIGNDTEFNVKFLEIKGLKLELYMNPTGTTAAGLVRNIKIPANAPKTISVKFNTRLNQEDVDLSWMPPNAGRPQPYIRIRFAREGLIGGGMNIPLQANKGWQIEHQKLDIPTGATHLMIEVRAYMGDALALGNWTIE